MECVQQKPNPESLTNFKKDELSMYEEVVKIWGDDVFITEDAHCINGHRDLTLCALRKKTGLDLDRNKLFALVHDIKVKHGYVTDVL